MLTQKRLKELIHYNSGVLFWIVSPSRSVKAGEICGNKRKSGYTFTSIDGIQYSNHRLVWLYHFGYFPENGIDHKDRDRSNNRISNLREASQSCNIRNSKIRNDNTSGVKGVYLHKNSNLWAATIKVKNKVCVCGYSKDFTESVAMRLAMEQSSGWSSCEDESPAYKYMQKYLLSAGS